MATKQGDLSLLDDPVAQELLQSRVPARLAYVWRDGTPRVVPIWFHWDGQDIVLATPLKAPKLQVLPPNAKVAVTIDSDDWPHKVLSVRGTATVETIAGVVPEYASAARRYLGEEGGNAWIAQASGLFSHMARIAIRPEWVGILDFQTRFPTAIADAIAAAGGIQTQ